MKDVAMQSIQTATLKSTDVAAAESAALATQAVEERAEQRFDAVRAELAKQGKQDEATASPEFREWMAARSETDAAWGRWAMAVDALEA